MKYEESPILELKEIINTDLKKEIVALANTDGGEILIGVARDGVVTAVEHPESLCATASPRYPPQTILSGR